MKRGFMNRSKYKRAIDEVYSSNSPPGPEPPRRGRPPSSRRALDGGKKADAARDRTGVKTKTAEGVSASDRVVWAAKRGSGVKTATSPRLHDNVNCTEAAPEPKDSKGKGKEKAVDAEDDDDDDHLDCIPPRPPPGRHGWGRNPDEEFFHTVPELHGGANRKRAIFRFWPRDPSGKPLVPNEKHKGTLSPDGYPWGATLYDFYQVNKIPEIQGLISIMTGSMLREVVEAIGELDAAAPEIEWAKLEGQPRSLGAADTEELIRCADTRLRLQRRFSFMFRGGDGGQMWEEGVGHEKEHEPTSAGGDQIRDDAKPNHIPPAPTIPITSPFHPSHYPKPWPFAPFENPFSILLQERIPLYLLPRTLYVHDPFCLLTARERQFRDTSWASRPDIIQAYDLHLSSSVRSQVEQAEKKAEELEEFKARTLIILRYQRTHEQIENREPIIEVPLPPYLRRPTKVEESHSYISPIAKVGDGHHSIVYKGELELPRDIFTKTRLCQSCFRESADKEVQRIKDTGRWGKMLKATSWVADGSTECEPSQADLDSVCDPINIERDGEIIEREITCIVPPDAVPSQIIEIIDGTGTWDRLMKERRTNAVILRFIREEDQVNEDSQAPIIRIDPPFTFESQRLNCTHDPCGPVPRTAKFTVVAKLSLENDPHLATEARNYQDFPEHFFHHYNGYTIITQLHTIVPVSAVVPQFYGYYIPKKGKNQGKPSYLSPILLLEHCGKPIDPEELSVEDQEECASLLLRFQRAGWLHESFAPRNFLIQYGKPTEFPLQRQCNPEQSFRLIDFGRSRKYEKAYEKRAEEVEALRMLDGLNGTMGVTLSM